MTLISALHSSKWYEAWFARDGGLMTDFNTKIIGIARVRQFRHENSICYPNFFTKRLNIVECYQELYASTRDIQNYEGSRSSWTNKSVDGLFVGLTFGEYRVPEYYLNIIT